MRAGGWLAGLFFLGAALLIAQAGDVQSRFREGNARYREGDFEAAIDLYESIIEGGYASGPLHYNLGNAYFRSGEIARAILNYERARRWIPTDEDLRHNLELAGRLTVDRVESVPRLFLWDSRDRVRDALSVTGWTILGLAGYVVILACGALFLVSRSPRMRRAAIRAGVATALLIVPVLYFLASRYEFQERPAAGIIMEGVVPVESAPDDTGNDAFVLHAGTRVRVEDVVGEWSRIRLEDGKTGWVRARAVEPI